MKRLKLVAVVKAKELTSNLNVVSATKRLKINRSSYYFKLTHISAREEIDRIEVEPIQTIFEERRKKVGIRQLQMLLQRRYGTTVNKKKIARLKRKFGLITLIRRKNKFNSFKELDHEHRTSKNIVCRSFSPEYTNQIYSTDITELKFDHGRQKAYLAAYKDLASKEIVSFEIMKTAPVELVVRALKKAVLKVPQRLRSKLIIHSDQGMHFTNFAYRNCIAKYGITQSMSRRGNCLDNAPIESFFGHLKDHLEIDGLIEFETLKKRVTEEIRYYNRERPQVALNKMPPASYRRHLESSGPLI